MAQFPRLITMQEVLSHLLAMMDIFCTAPRIGHAREECGLGATHSVQVGKLYQWSDPGYGSITWKFISLR